MPASKPTIYLIAGCNGAGKTTFAKEFLPHEVKYLRFYNADEIARGLSPLDLTAGAFRAGRLLLTEVRSSIARRETFALESTLSGTTYVRLFKSALARGYDLELHYSGWRNPGRPSPVFADVFEWADITSRLSTSGVASAAA